MACGASAAFAQLTTRENADTVVKLGARPQAGNMAFVLGMSLNNGSGKAALFSGNSFKSGNLLMYKYYLSDDLVFRAGIRYTNNSYATKGSAADSSAVYNPYGVNTYTNSPFGSMVNFSEIQSKTSERMWEIVPGIEKHFLSSNIFDAYVGGDLYLGLGNDVSISNIDYRNGDKMYVTQKTRTTNLGIGLVSGFNVFVAHLPIAIGLEYGWSAKWTFGGVTKVSEDRVVAGSTGGTYSVKYQTDNSPDAFSDAKYSKLKKREFNADSFQDLRLVLHFYFARK